MELINYVIPLITMYLFSEQNFLAYLQKGHI